MSDRNTSGAFWTGFVLGGLAGAAAALLMTPQSGQQTRVQLQEKSIELKGRVDEVASGLQERGKVTIEKELLKREAPPSEDKGQESGETSGEDADAAAEDTGA